jgi:acetylornithine deacetylase/succinyl-diaminopimelate desuccinylase-like protein
MTREKTIEKALAFFDDGGYVEELSRRVAVRTESQKPEQRPELYRYLEEEITPAFQAMGHDCQVFDNPVDGKGPVLLATRIEDENLPTVLGYGHGDVIRGLEDQWYEGLSPWETVRDGDRLYGRGTADNKGQHTINMNAMRIAMETRGALGFNSKFMVETGEENGSPGLHELVSQHLDVFSADVFIASDGPRVSPDMPTIFLGARGVKNFDLVCELREGGHHSGNWGGLLANPGIILSHALASIVSETGRIKVKEWLPGPLPNSVKAALRGLTVDGGENAPEIDEGWGEPDLSAAEQVYGWNSFEVLAFKVGNPDRPVNAVPPRAWAHCQLRFIADTDRDAIIPALRKHLDENGFDMVEVQPPPDMNAGDFGSTRTDPENPWAVWASNSLERTIGSPPAVIPQLGGSICNDVFTDLLDLPTIWVPHSYASCSQHAPNEHILLSEARSAIELMAGLYWDLGEGDTPAQAV